MGPACREREHPLTDVAHVERGAAPFVGSLTLVYSHACRVVVDNVILISTTDDAAEAKEDAECSIRAAPPLITDEVRGHGRG